MALTRERVLQLRNDLSQFLIHLTRTGDVTYRKDIFPQLPQDRIVHRTAKERLEGILTSGKIRAISPFGYFHYKVPIRNYFGRWTNPGSNVKREWLKAVCFTETPLDHIHIQTQAIQGRNLHFEPYGLAFKEDFIRRQGGTPVMYFESSVAAVRQSLDDMATSQDAVKFKSKMPLYESFGRRIYGFGSDVDFRWEREWRSSNDVVFNHTDVAFGLCKAGDIAHFEALVNHAFPFVDPGGGPNVQNHIQQVKARLRGLAHLADLK